MRSRRPTLFNAADLKRVHVEASRRLLAEGVNSVCCVPLISRNRVLGTLNVASLLEAALGQEEISLLNRIAIQVTIAVDNALAYQQIAEIKSSPSPASVPVMRGDRTSASGILFVQEEILYLTIANFRHSAVTN